MAMKKAREGASQGLCPPPAPTLNKEEDAAHARA